MIGLRNLTWRVPENLLEDTDGLLRQPTSVRSVRVACCPRFLLTAALLMTSSHSEGAGDLLWMLKEPDFNFEILVQVASLALHLAKVPGTQKKMIAAGVLELCRTKLNVNLRAFNRSADVQCAMTEVALIGREESNNNGVSPAIIDKVINELTRIAAKEYVMLVIHSGRCERNLNIIYAVHVEGNPFLLPRYLLEDADGFLRPT